MSEPKLVDVRYVGSLPVASIRIADGVFLEVERGAVREVPENTAIWLVKRGDFDLAQSPAVKKARKSAPTTAAAAEGE